MNSPVRILIVNVHSAENAGDLALLQTTIALLRRVFSDASFRVSSNYPDEQVVKDVADRVVASPWKLAGGGTQRKTRYLVLNLLFGWFAALTGLYRLPVGPWKSWRPLYDAYLDADLVVAVSGNQFFSSGRYGWPLLAIALSVKLAEIFKIPAYIMPQSIGPLRSRWERWLLRYSYAKARKIFIRDLQSMRLVQDVQLPPTRVKFTPDPAFTLDPASQAEALSILQKYGYHPEIPSMGVTVIASMPSYLDPQKITNYYRSLAEGLSNFANHRGVHLFFFYQVIGPSSHEDDRIATREVIRLLRTDEEKIHLVPEILSPAQLKACYGVMDIFLASRLHSGIFSMSMGVPTIFVGYLSKTRGVLETLDLEQNLLELDVLSPEALLAKLDSLWLEKDLQKEALSEKTKGIVEQIHAAVSSIHEDFYIQNA